MPLKDDSWIDPSKRATEHLNEALDSSAGPVEDLVILDKKLIEKETSESHINSSEPQQVESIIEETPTVLVDEAQKEVSVLENTSNRQEVRLLIITKDLSVLQEGTATQKRIIDEAGRFQEIHVVVLNFAREEENIPVTRIAPNAWLYPTNSSSWWMLAYDAYKTVQSQLVFSGGFRADIIVAEDLYQSGMVGVYVGQKFKRPLQLHVYEDFYDESYKATQEHPALYEWCVEHVLKRVKSVRTKTEFQRQAIINENELLKERTEILPAYYSLDTWDNFEPSHTLHDTYPQFKFTILHISSMQKSSHTEDVITAAAKILTRYPTIGLIIVGSGPLRAQFEKQVIALGLQNQIEFEPMPMEIISHMKSANVFVHLSEDGIEDELILMAAVSKVPLIANGKGLAGRLFVDGESACLCEPGDIDCVADAINRYLNENHDRANFAINAHDVVLERIEQDYGAYLEAYAESIERCVADVG